MLPDQLSDGYIEIPKSKHWNERFHGISTIAGHIAMDGRKKPTSEQARQAGQLLA
jgi:hypothetical protein